MLPAPYVPDPTDEELELLKKCAIGVVAIFASVFILGGAVVLVDAFVRDPAPVYCGWPWTVVAEVTEH